jgi:hypothetical protein
MLESVNLWILCAVAQVVFCLAGRFGTVDEGLGFSVHGVPHSSNHSHYRDANSREREKNLGRGK